ncbi:MAG: hypothetical protein FWD25_10105, partial [Clostridia bacterium]|nr:hypothetical protein [Clostridia bacterium]
MIPFASKPTSPLKNLQTQKTKPCAGFPRQLVKEPCFQELKAGLRHRAGSLRRNLLKAQKDVAFHVASF